METLRWLWAKLRGIPARALAVIGVTLLLIFVLYYPIGMIAMHHIDDDPDFKAGAFDIPGGSHSVAITEALLDREINQHRWVPNDPFFIPSSMLVRMPAFQRGIVSGLSRFAIELSDQIGRARGSSQADSDLENAAGLLKYSPNVWTFDLSLGILPTTPSEDQYLSALQSLKKYNERLAKGQAVFDRRADNLMEALDRISTDMGSSSAILDTHIHDFSHRFVDGGAADKFYFIKGRLYAYYMLMRELQKDFPDLIREKQLQGAWENTLTSLREGMDLGHFFIFNGSTDGQFIPNHLAIQGFYLLRARTQLREITNILLK